MNWCKSNNSDVNVDVGYDGPELIDIDNAALNPVHTLRIQDTADVSVRSSRVKSSEVQQRKPGSHGHADDDDASRSVDATVHAEHENITTQTGNNLVVVERMLLYILLLTMLCFRNKYICSYINEFITCNIVKQSSNQRRGMYDRSETVVHTVSQCRQLADAAAYAAAERVVS